MNYSSSRVLVQSLKSSCHPKRTRLRIRDVIKSGLIAHLLRRDLSHNWWLHVFGNEILNLILCRSTFAGANPSGGFVILHTITSNTIIRDLHVIEMIGQLTVSCQESHHNSQMCCSRFQTRIVEWSTVPSWN